MQVSVLLQVGSVHEEEGHTFKILDSSGLKVAIDGIEIACPTKGAYWQDHVVIIEVLTTSQHRLVIRPVDRGVPRNALPSHPRQLTANEKMLVYGEMRAKKRRVVEQL